MYRAVGNDYGVILRRLVKDTQGKRSSDLNAYEATLLYHHYHTTFGLEAHARALAAIERAVQLDPQYAVGWAQLICLYGDVYALGYAGPQDALERAEACARQALALDPECQEVRSNTAFIRFLSHQHADAIRHADKAIELNPNNTNFVCHSGFYIGLSGELDRGRKIIDDVWRLNPFLPGWLSTVAFIYHLVRAEYEAAFREARRFRMPNMAWDPLLRAASAGYLDNRSAMIKAYRELTEQFPDVASNPTETIRKYFHFDQWVDAMLKGLEMAKSAAR